MTRLLSFAARTDVGPRRTWNEDAVAVFTAEWRIDDGDRFADSAPADDGVALLVLDGMGGQSSGGIACARICAYLGEHLAGPWPDDVDGRGGWLVALVRRLSAHLLAISGEFTGQAAAMALAMVVGDVVHVVHVGDVRAYLLREGRLTRLTRDDTLVNHAREQGVAEADLEGLPRNVLVQLIGVGEPAPHLTVLRLAEDDVLLLCSDGLHAVVDDAAITETLLARSAPVRVCAELVDLAVRADSEDNISALVARREDGG